jgi:glycosyltransferase involved in cell wall biosynthesis
MRILLNAQLLSFEHTYRNAGLSRYIWTLLRGLSEANTEHQIAAIVASPEIARTATDQLGTSSHLRFIAGQRATTHPILRAAWEQTALPALARGYQADVLHGPGQMVPLRASCPTVVTFHDLAFMRYPHTLTRSRRIYLTATARQSVCHAAQVVAISRSTRDEICALLGTPADRVSVISPAVDGDFVPCLDQARLAAFRARHQLPERYLLFVGTLEPRKNLDGLLDAYARLRALLPEAPPLVIAGARGWYFERIYQRARTLGLADLVRFPGYIERAEQPLWYAASAAFLYPSLYEGFGLPVIEALACGVPVMTGDRPGTTEAAGHVAIRIDPSDVECMAQAMRRTLTDQHIKRHAMALGPLWAQQFSRQRMAAQYLEVYTKLGSLAVLWQGMDGKRNGHGSRRPPAGGERHPFDRALDPDLTGDVHLGSRAGSPHRPRARD